MKKAGRPTRTKSTSAYLDLIYKLEKAEAGIEGLEYYIKTEAASRLVYTIRRTGSYKGEIIDFTPKQYRELAGKPAKPAIINKKTGKIPWEYALDELASEWGYRSDEELKKAAENVGKGLRQIEELKRDKASLEIELKEIHATKGRQLIATEIDLNGQVKAKDIRLGARRIGTIIRIPSEWRIIWTENGMSPAAVEAPLAKVRYAKDIKKAVEEVYGPVEKPPKPKKDAKQKTKKKKTPSTSKR